MIPRDCLAGSQLHCLSSLGVLFLFWEPSANVPSVSGKCQEVGAVLLFFILLSCRGIYVQTHTRQLANSFPASAQARFVSLFTLYYNKISHTHKRNPVHSCRLHFPLLSLFVLYWSSRTCRYFFSSRFSFSDMGGRS